MDYLQLKQQNQHLREHQVVAKGKIFEAWDECDAVMLQMPTGTGKTYLFTSIIHDLVAAYKEAHRDVHILVVAHRMELLDQISATLTRFGIPHGFIQGQREQHLWRRVQVASIMSVLTEKNYYNTVRLQYDYIIVDEAHHSLADTYVELFNLFPDAKKLGVTATPWRLNHESFLKLYQKLILSPQISWFIDKGLLADFDYVSIRPDSEIQRLVNSSEVAESGDFSNADLDNTFNNQRIRSKVYESYERFACGRKGIIYAINRQHASKIAALYSSHGVHAVAIDCDTPKEERQRLISLFKAGEVQVLVNVDIFTEGFDCPDVSFIQLARPTRSLALYLQQVGRGLRMVEGKEKTIIIDNVGLYNYFGLPDANRKWQHHFKGLEGMEESARLPYEAKTVADVDGVLDEEKFQEDDGQMMVVRGASSLVSSSLSCTAVAHEASRSEVLPVLEFSLCNYYLVRGNAEKCRIYPFVKKKGRTTEAVNGCVYEYDGVTAGMILSDCRNENLKMIEGDSRLYAILSFVAMLLKRNLRELLDLDFICRELDRNKIKSVNLFDWLLMVSQLK